MESSINEMVRVQLERGIRVLQQMAADEALQQELVRAAEATVAALKKGGKLLVAGNGGSAADAQHLVAELVCRLRQDRRALRAVALTTDTSILTAVANDYGFERSISRQIEALGDAGDVFLGISTSGNSPNILRALEAARARGLCTVGLTGAGGGEMAALCDVLIAVPSTVTMYIQQAHLTLEHLFCMLIEDGCFGAEFTAAAMAATEEKDSQEKVR